VFTPFSRLLRHFHQLIRKSSSGGPSCSTLDPFQISQCTCGFPNSYSCNLNLTHFLGQKDGGSPECTRRHGHSRTPSPMGAALSIYQIMGITCAPCGDSPERRSITNSRRHFLVKNESFFTRDFLSQLLRASTSASGLRSDPQEAAINGGCQL
jgi:hypothetical protein